MALSTDQYGYLIDPLVPITDATGRTIKDGFLRVYIAGSSTPVITYRNYDGAVNEKTIELDNSGRCKHPVIVSKSLAYKVVVYDAQHSQETPIITVDKLFAIGASVMAGAGSTVVQGLDNVEGESDGFVKASVTGTTASVKLDATNVSHELTNDSAVGDAANAGYMVPVLSNDSEDPDDPQKLPLAWLWANKSTQVVLSPSDFIGTGLSNDEWAAAVAAISGGKTAVVKWIESGASRVASFSRYEAGVGMVFVSELGGYVTEYVVAAAPGAHAVTTNVYEMAGSLSNSITKFDVMWDIDGNDYVFPEAQDVINAVGSYIEVQLVFHSPAGVNFVYALTYKSTVHYEWTREDCQSKFNLDGAGSPTVWTWTEGDTSLKRAVVSLEGNAGKIYKTLQDAITDAANLSVSDIFETNGFKTSGDGGAARYVVSSTGTANGMDIIQLSVGKLAIAQLKGSAYTEQIGYEVSSAQADVTPYINRLLAMGIQEIKFYPTGSAPTACYCIRDTLDLDRADYHNVGVHLKGADIGGTSGYFTWFNFQPSVSNTDKIAIKIRSRTTEIENIALIYADGKSDASVRGSSAGICFDSTGNSSYQTSSYGAVLKNLVIHGFNTAILSMGDSPYIWHVDFEKITFASNNTNVSLDGLSYCTKFRNCLFNSPDVQSVYLGEPFTTEFESCNFGIDDRGTTIIRSSKWIVPSAPVDEKRGTTLFVNCNFEVEYRGSAVPQNNTHLFVYSDDNSQIDFEFDNCCFIYTPLSRENVFSDRMFSLGSGCSAIIRNSTGPYSDVNYTGNEFYGKDYDKYFFDENRPPRKKVGSVILQHCEGIDPFPFLDDEHLPCYKKDEDVILCSDTTGLDTFERIEDGTILFNLDRHIPIIKIANDFAYCASAPSGVVRIGNELYNYVTFDGRKWITRNLNLRIPTRQHTIFDHLEWGQYYKYSDLAAIQAELPSGWRIPNASDISSIKGDGSATRAHNLQSLGVSYWTEATNSTGFSALPSTWWYKPNTTPHSTFKQYAFYWTTATEGSNVKNISIAPNAVSSGGWTAGEAASLWIPIRVCADA